MATPLERVLKTRIAAEGPLSFSEVMRAALYDATYGYYTNLRGFGADGDFITSPERHPAFGWLLGRQALDVWETLDRPSPFRVLELGGGSGALAESLIGFLRGRVPDLTYTMDEVSPSLRQVQRQRLTGPEFRWYGSDDEAHFIIANEVADALPVHRATLREGCFHELLVGLGASGDDLQFQEADQSHEDIAAYFAPLGYVPPDQSVVDVSLELGAWMHALSERLNKGVALVIDYGASPPRDTLLTYYRHTMGSDPLVRLGQQDLSAHVDLQTLMRLAVTDGLNVGSITQRRLLMNLGVQQLYATSTGQTDREALQGLVDANGPGGQISAVFLVRGMPAPYKPVGVIGREWPAPLDVPRVPPDQDESDFLNQWREAFADSEDTQEEVAKT